MLRYLLAFALLLGPAVVRAAPEPIIDMHLHALAADDQGPPPITICAPYDAMPTRDAKAGPQQYFADVFKRTICAHPIVSSPDDDTLRRQSLALLARFNITAVTSGTAARVKAWRDAAPTRILSGLMFGMSDLPSIDTLRKLHAAGQLDVIGEIGTQYEGVAPNDPRLEPLYTLAEELDVPIAIHMGPGPPGAPYLGITAYRMAAGDPLLLEDVLVRHPKMRLYVMHAGWPMADRMIALLYTHPQVYVDTGVIDYTQPRAEFWSYLKRLIDAGYGKRIMFGSDQMVWPEAIPVAIDSIRSAPFLTPAQKREILYNNAARFLRLTH